MPKLNLPDVLVKIKDDGELIFDPVRRKWVKTTPEEWVRQNIVLYLHHYLHYPLSLMETEKQFKLFNTIKRADIILNDIKLNPLIIVECKSPEIKVDQTVIDQAMRYNMALNVAYLFVSNGMKHFAIKINEDKPVFLKQLPDYNSFLTQK